MNFLDGCWKVGGKFGVGKFLDLTSFQWLFLAYLFILHDNGMDTLACNKYYDCLWRILAQRINKQIDWGIF